MPTFFPSRLASQTFHTDDGHKSKHGSTQPVTAIFLALSLLLISGCKTSGPKPGSGFDIKEANKRVTEAFARLDKVTIAQARAHYANRTFKSFDTAHGTQVEYLDRANRCYLWYPGNRSVLPCKWKIVKTERVAPLSRDKRKYAIPNICFSYPANSRNPVTGHRGSAWQCKNALMTQVDKKGAVSLRVPPPGFGSAAIDTQKGDPFGLSTRRTVPFVMEKKRYGFADLKKRAK